MANRPLARGWEAATKLTVARQLARLNVDVIEAGYPASSPDDFEAVRQISREIQVHRLRLSRAVRAISRPAARRWTKPRVRVSIPDRLLRHPHHG